MSGARLNLAGALVLGLTVGCQASLNADANANVNGEGAKARAEADLDGSAEGQGEMSRKAAFARSDASSSPSPAEGSGPARVLLGARHDLKLHAGSATASCECLAVALGGSQSAGMAWSGTAPPIDDETQLSIALSSDGQTCKGQPKPSLGASYWGYRIKGNDVVVLVEAAHRGRPVTTGAIIPKPVGAGQVYVAPASRKLPYGRALGGKGPCKVGNPGSVRNAPFSELEVGQNPPEGYASGGRRGERALSDQSSEDTPTTIELPSN